MSTADQLVADCVSIVSIESVSGNEAALADFVEQRLRSLPVEGEVTRLGDNVIFRRRGLSGRSLVIAGHLDTVPQFSDDVGLRHEDGRIYGLGAADMKGGLSVMLSLAALEALRYDTSFVFYVCEEVDAHRNGLRTVLPAMEFLKEADGAVLMEPTSNFVEAGCQGTLRFRLDLHGVRAHTARPWMGTNAVARLEGLLGALRSVELREPIVEGIQYREALSVVRVQGGVANNVVPDLCSVWVNHRFAPDRSAEVAFGAIEATLRASGVLIAEDVMTIEDAANGARPGLEVDVIRTLSERSQGVRAKLGWTDVSYFSALGVPGVNFGPGDPLQAHTAGEWVEEAELHQAYEVLEALLVATK